MSDLIGGPEVLRALADGFDVLWRSPEWSGDNWHSMLNDWCLDAKEILDERCYREDTESYQPVIFKIKPKTITINGVEVPAPDNGTMKEDDICWHITGAYECGYSNHKFDPDCQYILGVWSTEEKIKQVVSALKQLIHTKP